MKGTIKYNKKNEHGNLKTFKFKASHYPTKKFMNEIVPKLKDKVGGYTTIERLDHWKNDKGLKASISIAYTKDKQK